MRRASAPRNAKNPRQIETPGGSGGAPPSGGGARLREDGVDAPALVEAPTSFEDVPRRQPRQERSRQVVAAVLEAAAELFGQLGYAGTTTNKIAARAGVSVGSLYQYYPNKDSLLAALAARHGEQVHAVVDKALIRLADPTVSLEVILRQLLGDLLAVHRRDPDLTRALSAQVRRPSRALHDDAEDAQDPELLCRLTALLAARPDVRAGDHLAMAAVLAQATAVLTRWLAHDPPPGLDQDVLLEEELQLLLRFLRR